MNEKNKINIFIAVIIVLFIGLFFLGKINQNQNKKISADSEEASSASASASALEIPEKFYDFGVISMKNGNVGKKFTVKNLSDKDIVFPSLTTSCMCTKAYFIKPDGKKKGPYGMPGMGFVPKLNETIKAGQSADIEMVYDPNAHGPAGVGMIDRFAYLEDGDGNRVEFEIKANVTP